MLARYNIHIKKLEINKAGVIMFKEGSSAVNKIKASAGVCVGFGNMCRLLSMKFNCSASKKIMITYNSDTKYASAFFNGSNR